MQPSENRPLRPVAAHAAIVLLGVLLLAILHLRLLLALLAGLAAFALYDVLRQSVGRHWRGRGERLLVLVLFWSVIVIVIVGIVQGLQALGIRSPGRTLAHLSELMADSLDRVRGALPPAVAEHIPDSMDALRESAASWLRVHAELLRGWGLDTVRAVVHLLVGLIIGMLAGMHAHDAPDSRTAFARAWREGLHRLVTAFTGVMGAQLRISAINTALTAVYLFVVLPVAGEHVPLARALVVLTFVAGLIPVIGNLISNTAIVLASLAVSPGLALASTAYLIGIHKLEYFLNARLVGGRINARTFEILAAMLLMEAVFGVSGVAAAPIYYAWLMGVLRDEGLL